MFLRAIKVSVKKVLIDKNAWYEAQFKNCRKFWKHFDFDLDVVNLGSNSAFYGFNYEGLPVKAANWAMQPQSFPQDFAILKTYFSFLGPRAIILIALGPYSSCYKSYTDTEMMKYYTILHPGAVENFSQEMQDRAYQLKENPWKYAPEQMFKGVFVTAKGHVKRLLHGNKTGFQKMTETQLEADANCWIDGWMNQFGISDMNAESLPEHLKAGREKRVAVLREMLSFCNEHGYKAFVVLPPVTKYLSSKFSETFRKNYIYSFLKEAGVPESCFLNYLEDEELSDRKLFFNSFFLNKTGASLFTRRVLIDIGVKV